MKRLVVFTLAASAVASTASAEPGFARMFRGRYGYEPACGACHTEGGGSDLTGYGEDFKKAGKSAKAFDAIEAADSDRDGATNLAEIKAKSNPGSAASTPSNPGNWLDPASLIPKEVQAVFPGVHTYKPLDAIFTAAEIERAKALGVTLTPDDETTIYVPFDSGKAQGAAVIVAAARGEGEKLYLVVAADRDLNLKSVVPIAVKGARPPPRIDPSLLGKHVDRVDVPGALPPDETAVATAVKKAAAILAVRLTKGAEK